MGEKLWELEQLDLLYIVWEGKTQISECKLQKSRSYFTLRKTPILFKWPINSEIPVAVNTSNTQDCGLFVLFPIKMNQSSLWTVFPSTRLEMYKVIPVLDMDLFTCLSHSTF